MMTKIDVLPKNLQIVLGRLRLSKTELVTKDRMFINNHNLKFIISPIVFNVYTLMKRPGSRKYLWIFSKCMHLDNGCCAPNESISD